MPLNPSESIASDAHPPMRRTEEATRSAFAFPPSQWMNPIHLQLLCYQSPKRDNELRTDARGQASMRQLGRGHSVNTCAAVSQILTGRCTMRTPPPPGRSCLSDTHLHRRLLYNSIVQLTPSLSYISVALDVLSGLHSPSTTRPPSLSCSHFTGSGTIPVLLHSLHTSLRFSRHFGFQVFDRSSQLPASPLKIASRHGVTLESRPTSPAAR